MALLLVAGVAPGAQAADVRSVTTSMGAKTIYIDAAPGEANRIVVSANSTDVYVADSGSALGSSDASCTLDGARRKCPLPPGFFIRQVEADLGDLDDTFSTTTPEPMLVEGDGGRDIIRGNSGRDELTGGLGNDDLYGNGGDDLLIDGLFASDEDGNDRQEGGAGDDTLKGGKADDVMIGGPGQDELWVANGVETTDGGPGIDAVVVDPAGGGAPPIYEDDYLLSLDGQANDGFRTSPERWSIGPGIEDLRGAFDDDVLIGDDGVNEIVGGYGDDRITPRGAPDTVDAGLDDDTIDAGDGSADRIFCGTDNDSAIVDSSDQHADCETITPFAAPIPPPPPTVGPDTTPAVIGLVFPRRGARLSNLRRGRVPSLRLTSNEAVSATVTLVARTRTFRIARAGEVELATRSLPRADGARSVRLKIARRLARRIGRRTKLRILVVAVDVGGNLTRRSYALKVRR